MCLCLNYIPQNSTKDAGPSVMDIKPNCLCIVIMLVGKQVYARCSAYNQLWAHTEGVMIKSVWFERLLCGGVWRLGHIVYSIFLIDAEASGRR